MQRPVYLVDLEGYRPDEEKLVDADKFRAAWRESKLYSEESILFMDKILDKSGLNRYGTFLPNNLNFSKVGDAQKDLRLAERECREVVFGAVDNLLGRLDLNPADIDVVVTTCSIYCPTPSMASMVVNHYKMRSNIQSYHLGGMGCSNGVVALSLIRDLLQARPNVNALFITTETTTPAYYQGTDRSRLVTNVIFRMGACAMLFSNKRSWGDKIKYELLHHYRIHTGSVDDAFRAIELSPDEEGHNGVYLGKNVVTEASKALTKAMTNVAPRIMTWRQVLEYLVFQLNQRRSKKSEEEGEGKSQVKKAQYIPNFTECVQHVLIHAGGAKILDGIGEALNLNEHYLLPSRRVLFDYGNVSSSSTWYTLAWVESCRGLKKGDKVMQVGVGSGMKCGVAVWRAKKDIRDVHVIWDHAVPEEEKRAIRAAQHVDSSYARTRIMFRLTFLLIMMVVMAVTHMYFMQSDMSVGLREEL